MAIKPVTPTKPTPPTGTGPGSSGGGAKAPYPTGQGITTTSTPSGGGPTGQTGTAASALTGANRDAYDSLVNLFTSYGLGSLAPTIMGYVQQGYGSDTITVLLQQTDAYKQRFAGNAIRQQNGLSVLSPADYLSAEQSYQAVMRAAGLPQGFYDSPQDFTNFIGQNVSASELQSRVTLASQATLTASPAYTQALQQMGLSKGDLTAYFLDPTKALPLLQQQANTAAIGSEALQRGLTFDQSYATQLAQAGFTQSQAAQGYGQISQEFNTFNQIAQQYGQGYTYGQEEQAVFQPGAGVAGSGNDLNSAQLQSRLASWARANVSGVSGGAAGGLARHGGGQLS